MNAAELRALADEYAAIADDKDAIKDLAEKTRKTHPSDNLANTLGKRCVGAADADAVRQICSEVK